MRGVEGLQSPDMRTLLALVVASVALVGCSALPHKAETSSSSSTSRPTEPEITGLQEVANMCGLAGRTMDDGTSLTLDTEGESDASGDTIEDVACVLGNADAPDFVTKHIESTRALDGQQTDIWDGYEARWTYHPDDGLQITVIDRS